MQGSFLIETFGDFAKNKSIDRPTMIRILEDVFRTLIKRKYGSDQNFDVIVNIEKGDLEIYRYRQIVEDEYDFFDENFHIMLTEAKKIQHDFEIGEAHAERIQIIDFGRRLVQTARQTLIQKVKDLEKDMLFQKYKDLVGEIMIGEVYQILNNKEVVIVDDDQNELILPKTEQIPKDRFRKGEMVKSVVHRVEMVNGTPKIILSRAAPKFLERLFEQEVPEVADSVIYIKKVVREPGERAKIAVESTDDRIDPVGACVGVKGSRIHNVVKELQNENIDVINFTENTELLIARSLSPAKLNSVKIDDEKRRATVTLNRDQVSLAIGKNGQNVKLASRLVDLEIDVVRDIQHTEYDEEDVELTEFDDAIDPWVIKEFQMIGLDTAKSVLRFSREALINQTDLEEETIDEVLEILKREFEDDQESPKATETEVEKEEPTAETQA